MVGNKSELTRRSSRSRGVTRRDEARVGETLTSRKRRFLSSRTRDSNINVPRSDRGSYRAPLISLGTRARWRISRGRRGDLRKAEYRASERIAIGDSDGIGSLRLISRVQLAARESSRARILPHFRRPQLVYARGARGFFSGGGGEVGSEARAVLFIDALSGVILKSYKLALF